MLYSGTNTNNIRKPARLAKATRKNVLYGMLLLSLEVIALSLARYCVACISTVRFVVKLEEQLEDAKKYRGP